MSICDPKKKRFESRFCATYQPLSVILDYFPAIFFLAGMHLKAHRGVDLTSTNPRDVVERELVVYTWYSTPGGDVPLIIYQVGIHIPHIIYDTCDKVLHFPQDDNVRFMETLDFYCARVSPVWCLRNHDSSFVYSAGF